MAGRKPAGGQAAPERSARAPETERPRRKDDPPRPCVWMSAGVVAYRLCDRDFDCEHCPLDAGLRGLELPREAAGAGGTGADDRWSFPDDRRYHRGHTWVLPLETDRLRCGLDAFAARMLRHARGIVLPALGTRVRAGRVAWWLTDGSHLVPLRAPASGVVVRRNEQVHDGASVQASPYDEGWLLDLRCAEETDARSGLLSATQARRRAEEHLRAFHGRVSSTLEQMAMTAGATRPDGGERLTDLRRILGPDRYYRLLGGFLR